MCAICLRLSCSIGDADILESSFMSIYKLLPEVDCIDVTSSVYSSCLTENVANA